MPSTGWPIGTLGRGLGASKIPGYLPQVDTGIETCCVSERAVFSHRVPVEDRGGERALFLHGLHLIAVAKQLRLDVHHAPQHQEEEDGKSGDVRVPLPFKGLGSQLTRQKGIFEQEAEGIEWLAQRVDHVQEVDNIDGPDRDGHIPHSLLLLPHANQSGYNGATHGIRRHRRDEKEDEGDLENQEEEEDEPAEVEHC